MKYFQLAQKHLAFLGLNPTQKSFNRKSSTAFLLCINSALNCALLFREIINFREYIDAIYMSTASIAIIIYFAILAVEMKNIFTLIETMEKIVEKSTS